MSLRILIPLLGATVLATAGGRAATAAEEQGRPADIGQAFCIAATPDIGRGLLYLFTPPFAQLVDDALTRSEKIAAARPDEKPPLADGIPYQSFPEQAPVCEVGDVQEVGGRTRVEIRRRFPDKPDAGWTDMLVLGRWHDHLMIDDILYGAQNYQRGLREVAQEVLNQ